MKITDSYHDLCKEIEVLELRIDSLEEERKYYTKLMYSNSPTLPSSIDYSSEKVTGDKPYMTLDRIVERLNKIDDNIKPLEDMANIKKNAKNQIEKVMSEFEGLEYKVAYLRDIKGLPLDAIADKLGYSYDWIRKISSRIKRSRVKN